MNAHLRPQVAQILLREDADGIATLTLNRPEARNPLSEAMLAALAETLAAIAQDASVRDEGVAGSNPATPTKISRDLSSS